jgi:glycosyltransferase involved in cell wall biosynthesis
MRRRPDVLRDPLLSVVMPVYNEAATIGDIISSPMAD